MTIDKQLTVRLLEEGRRVYGVLTGRALAAPLCLRSDHDLHRGEVEIYRCSTRARPSRTSPVSETFIRSKRGSMIGEAGRAEEAEGRV